MKNSYREQLDEIDAKYSKPQKDKKKKKKKDKRAPKPGGLNGYLQGFNEQQAKGNVNVTLLKTIADLAGVGLGTAVSAAAGKVAPLLGIALIGAGHYVGDQSGLLRVVGTATVAHSVAKSKEYRNEGSTIKDRLSGLKDDWLRLAIAKHEGQKTVAVPVPPATVVKVEQVQEPTPAPIPTVQPAAERRKTPYELEIEQRQREIEEEAEQMREEMAQADREREEKNEVAADPQEIDMSGLDAVEQSLYGAAQQHLQTGDFTDFDQFENDDPDPFDDEDFHDLAPDEETEDERQRIEPESGRSRQLWPPVSQRSDYDLLDEDDYNFNDY